MRSRGRIAKDSKYSKGIYKIAECIINIASPTNTNKLNYFIRSKEFANLLPM